MRAGQENPDVNMSFHVNLDSKGRVLLPAELRKKAGFKEGDLLNISLDADRIAHISGMHKKISSLRGILKTTGRNVVDELIAERRKEALND